MLVYTIAIMTYHGAGLAFQGIGLEEGVRSVMETHTRAMIEEARRSDQDTITRLVQQLAVPSTGPPSRPSASWNSNFLDMRLGKPEVFAGKEAKWEEWYFKFKAYMTSVGGNYASLLAACETTNREIKITDLDEDDAAQSRKLYLALVMLTSDAALRIVQSVTDNNGLEALRRLTRRFNPVTQGRVLATLNAILQVDLGGDEAVLMDRVVQWEEKITEFEQLSREILPDIIKRAIITERAPAQVKTHLLVNAQTLATYQLVRAAVESFVTAGRQWGSSSTPMEVDALYAKGKGKDKRKDKGTWKGKEKSKEKGVKGKEKGKKGKEHPKHERFEGYCGKCGKWGHKHADCWSTIAAVEGCVDRPEPADTSGLKALTGMDDEPPQDGVNGWILALGPGNPMKKGMVKILADSGSSETCGAPHHFPGVPEESAPLIRLRTATGSVVESDTP